MPRRFLPWLLLGVFFAAFCVRVEAQGLLKPGKILVVKVTGSVTKTVAGKVIALQKDMAIEIPAKVNTGPGSSVMLVFSNGSMVRLGETSELLIDEFLQEPFASTIAVRELTEEPSPSRTKLTLTHGDLVADVKKLKRPRDGFTVHTPAGAISVRGTVFRIVVRPAPNGQAVLQVATASGLVHFTPAPSGGSGGNAGQSGAAAGASAAGIDIPQGQEITLLFDFTTNAQGQWVVPTLPPLPQTPTQASAETMMQTVMSTGEMAAAGAGTKFEGRPDVGTVGR